MTDQPDPGKQLKLRPRLVPEPLWGLSAYRLLKQSQWLRIRRDALAAAAGTCAICGAVREKGTVCDEEWAYEGGVALLTGTRILCPDCNAVTHLGRTGLAGYGDVALEHMARVNGTTVRDAQKLTALQFEVWRQRSQGAWTVAVASDLLARYPFLEVLVGLTSAPGSGQARYRDPKPGSTDLGSDAAEFGDGSTGTEEDVEYGWYLRELALRDD